MKLTWLAFLSVCAWGQSLDGVIDIHVHADPDSVGRSIDAIDLAKLAKSRGMRGLVFKNHWESTAAVAYLVRKEVPGLEVFGGIVLNLAVGGINPVAVERMAMLKGGYGRVVWMPTYDAENHIKDSKENRPFVPITKNGELLPEVKEVIGVVARRNLTLETGHLSPQESLMVIREARKQGVERIVVTHAMTVPVRMTIDQMKQAAGLGALLELVYGRMNLPDYVRAIREVGPEHIILATDLGQPRGALHPDGMLAYLTALKMEGFSDAELALMSRTNPARALGLP